MKCFSDIKIISKYLSIVTARHLSCHPREAVCALWHQMPVMAQRICKITEYYEPLQPVALQTPESRVSSGLASVSNTVTEDRQRSKAIYNAWIKRKMQLLQKECQINNTSPFSTYLLMLLSKSEFTENKLYENMPSRSWL